MSCSVRHPLNSQPCGWRSDPLDPQRPRRVGRPHVLGEEVAATGLENTMGLVDHHGWILDPTEQERADDTVDLTVGDVDRLTCSVLISMSTSCSAAWSPESVVHHRVRFDCDDTHAGGVVAHVDAGAGSEFDDRARHRTDLGGLAFALRLVVRLGRRIEHPRLEATAQLLLLEVDHGRRYSVQMSSSIPRQLGPTMEPEVRSGACPGSRSCASQPQVT